MNNKSKVPFMKLVYSAVSAYPNGSFRAIQIPKGNVKKGDLVIIFTRDGSRNETKTMQLKTPTNCKVAFGGINGQTLLYKMAEKDDEFTTIESTGNGKSLGCIIMVIRNALLVKARARTGEEDLDTSNTSEASVFTITTDSYTKGSFEDFIFWENDDSSDTKQMNMFYKQLPNGTQIVRGEDLPQGTTPFYTMEGVNIDILVRPNYLLAKSPSKITVGDKVHAGKILGISWDNSSPPKVVEGVNLDSNVIYYKVTLIN